MNADDSGSVSRALNQGGDENREFVIARSMKLYAGLWSSIAKRILPAERRRCADDEDAVQETLLELDRILRRPGHSLKTREDIRRLGIRILTCNAKDVLESNLKVDGESVAGGRNRADGGEAGRESSLAEVAGNSSSVPSPQATMVAAEIQAQVTKMDRVIADQLASLSGTDRDIVAQWLDWKSFRGIAEAVGVTLRDVRNTTFDFKTGRELAQLAGELRSAIAEAESSESGVINRIQLSLSCGRVLCDLRDDS